VLDDKQKVINGIFIIILVTILTFGSSSYSLVSAVSSQSSIDHDKASVKKQESRSDADDGSSSKDKDNGDGSSGSSRHDSSDASSRLSSRISNSDTKSSDNSNNVGGIENNNNNEAANDGSNTGAGENVPSIGIAIPTPHRSCDQGSNCNDQQDPSNTDHPTAPTATKQNNTPFVLSLPFP